MQLLQQIVSYCNWKKERCFNKAFQRLSNCDILIENFVFSQEYSSNIENGLKDWKTKYGIGLWGPKPGSNGNLWDNPANDTATN